MTETYIALTGTERHLEIYQLSREQLEKYFRGELQILTLPEPFWKCTPTNLDNFAGTLLIKNGEIVTPLIKTRVTEYLLP